MAVAVPPVYALMAISGSILTAGDACVKSHSGARLPRIGKKTAIETGGLRA